MYISNKQKILYRFYKENDLYAKYRHINDIGSYGIDFFDKYFHWGNTNEGHRFWLNVQCEFIIFCIKNNCIKISSKERMKEYFEDILTKGYFGHDFITKRSDKDYKKYSEIYKEIYGTDILNAI